MMHRLNPKLCHVEIRDLRFQSGRDRLGRMKIVRLFRNWHGGVMVKAVVYEAQEGED